MIRFDDLIKAVQTVAIDARIVSNREQDHLAGVLEDVKSLQFAETMLENSIKAMAGMFEIWKAEHGIQSELDRIGILSVKIYQDMNDFNDGNFWDEEQEKFRRLDLEAKEILRDQLIEKYYLAEMVLINTEKMRLSEAERQTEISAREDLSTRHTLIKKGARK